jgi:methanogenic corrinoid protein MtbC1
VTEAATELGVHYMTAYRFVRTGKLPALWVAGAWQILRADLDLVKPSLLQPPKSRASAGRDALPGRLGARLVAGDEAGAWGLVEHALGESMAPSQLVLEAVVPALSGIGEDWLAGVLSVADEHRATAVTNRLIGRLGARFARRGVKRGTVLLASPAGELHALPVAMGTNLLRWEGFGVVELGADCPPAALAEAVASQPGLLAVGLACTTAASATAAAAAMDAVRAVPDCPALLLGGAGVRDGSHAHRLGADIYTGRRGDGLVAAVQALAAGGR